MPSKILKPLTHIVDIRTLDKKFIKRVFDRAKNMGHRHTDDSLKGKSMLWIAPPQAASTRTHLSFAAAIEDLGGHCRELPENSSMKGKKESFRDTVQVVGSYHDVIVIRSNKEDPYTAIQWSPVSVINAGNGPDQHPTQAMMTLFTLLQKFGSIEGLNIVLAGDLRWARAARSDELAIATFYPHNTIDRVSPPGLEMGEDVTSYSKERGVVTHNVKHLGDVIRKADVVMMYRNQSEHQTKGLPVTKTDYPVLTVDLARMAGNNALFMHPLPANRDTELPYEIDDFPQSVYLKEQLWSGPRIRKAILQELLT